MNKFSENKQNEDTIASYEKQIEQLKEELKNESNEKESEIQRHKAENETFASTFRDKFDELKILKIDLTCKSKENAVLTLKLSDMQKEIEKKGSDLQKCMLKNEALVATVWEKYVKIRTLEAEVEL